MSLKTKRNHNLTTNSQSALLIRTKIPGLLVLYKKDVWLDAINFKNLILINRNLKYFF